jgi:DNA invertase Pin-like site-specific DNA recombinase
MNYVSIDQLDRTDIERALDEAFAAIRAKGPVGVPASQAKEARVCPRVEAMKMMAREGVPVKLIAQRLGYSTAWVYRVLKENGVAWKRGARS